MGGGGAPKSGVIRVWFWQLSPTAPRAFWPPPFFGCNGLVLNLQKTGLFAYLHKLRICKTTPRFPRHLLHLQQDDHVQLELSSPAIPPSRFSSLCDVSVALERWRLSHMHS